MNGINLYNYENYFLLYIDGELSDIQVEEMDRFIANNPNLADELCALQETKLPLDETIVFSHKSALLKQATTEVSLENYETYFLLYIDDELSIQQKETVELFVLQHPVLQESFLLLQQTKLKPELVVFNNKEVLYRKEEKSRPVVFMRWASIAVAASMIGFVAMLWVLAPKNNLKESVTFSAANRTIYKKADIKTAAKIIVEKENSQQKNSTALLGEQNSNNRSIIKKVVGNIQINKQHNVVKDRADQTAFEHSENKLNNQSTSTTTIAGNIVQQDNTVNTVSVNEEDTQAKINIAQRAIAEDEEEQAQRNRPEVYKELDTEDDKSLYIGALELNKDKVRGFFRKAGNIFRSKNKSDEDGRNKK